MRTQKAFAALLTCALLLGGLSLCANAAVFPDVPENAWFADDVTYAVEKGLVNGKNGVYAPDDNVTIAECVKLAAVLHQQHYGNESIQNGENYWYSNYVNYALSNKIINKAYSYASPATRGQMAEIFAGLPDEMLPQLGSVEDNAIPDVRLGDACSDAIYRLYRAGIMGGKDTKGTCYPADYFKRSELARILRRLADPSTRVSLSLRYVAPATVSDTRVGNTQGNWANRALFVQDGDWIYYQDDALVRSKADGSEYTVLSTDYPRGINLGGDYVYYTCQSEDKSVAYVKRVRKDAAETAETLLEGECTIMNPEEPLTRLMRVGDQLVFGNYTIDDSGDSGYIGKTIEVYRLNDDKTRVLVGPENWNEANDSDPKNLQAVAYDYTVYGNTIYYSTGRYRYNCALCKINLDGSGFAKIADVEDACYRLQIVDGWLYYLEGATTLKDAKRMQLSTGTIESIPLKQGTPPDIYVVGQKVTGISQMNVIGSKIYYTNANDALRMYDLVDGSDQFIVTTTHYFGVTEDYLCYFIEDDGYHFVMR